MSRGASRSPALREQCASADFLSFRPEPWRAQSEWLRVLSRILFHPLTQRPFASHPFDPTVACAFALSPVCLRCSVTLGRGCRLPWEAGGLGAGVFGLSAEQRRPGSSVCAGPAGGPAPLSFEGGVEPLSRVRYRLVRGSGVAVVCPFALSMWSSRPGTGWLGFFRYLVSFLMG